MSETSNTVSVDLLPIPDAQVASTLDALVRNDEFVEFLAKYRLPQTSRFALWLTRAIVRRKLRAQLAGVRDVDGFQNVMSHYVRRIVQDTMRYLRYEGTETLPVDEASLFVGNHRDIAADSMCLNYALYYSGHKTVRIAVGDNLIQKSFATDLMRLNKSFFVRRNVEGTRKQYAALLESSAYIHASLAEGESIWIAQSEGRAKDGRDLTDPAVIKMLALADRRTPFPEVIRRLKIVPIAIAYEFDPCDCVKARELTLNQPGQTYEKPEGEDLRSLVLGLAGDKGRVILRIGKALEDTYDDAESVAEAINRQVLSGYQLFPINYLALERLQVPGNDTLWSAVREIVDTISADDRRRFEARLGTCDPQYQARWLEAYANPVLNKWEHGGENMQLP